MSTYDPSLDPQRLEQGLTDRQKACRDAFVNEYIKDYDPFKACIRMGFLASFAIDQCKAFMSDGYVLRKIAQIKALSVQPSEEDKAAMLANQRELALSPAISGAVRSAATQRYMEAQGYVKSEADAAITANEALANLLANFGKQAPA